MTDSSDAVRCWLVERTFDDRNLVTLVYATPDGTDALPPSIARLLTSLLEADVVDVVGRLGGRFPIRR